MAHALHWDGEFALAPWVKFASAETLAKALRYLGATGDQLSDHRKAVWQTGEASSHI
jgi:hypothetical protein